MAIAEYELGKGKWVNVAFGRDSKDDLIEKCSKEKAPGNLIAQLGLKFSLTGDRFKLLNYEGSNEEERNTNQ